MRTLRYQKCLTTLLLALGILLVNAQASYTICFAFRLFDEDGKQITGTTFNREFEVADLYGDIMNFEYPNRDPHAFLEYNSLFTCFIVNISTIGQPFSFSLYHKGDTMNIFLPTYLKNTTRYPYRAVDSLPFLTGTFLLDRECNEKTTAPYPNNAPFCYLRNVDWELQEKKFRKSEWYRKE